MNRHFLFLMVASGVLAAASANAQITISAGNMLSPGATLQMVTASYVTVDVGSAGADQTWTVPEYDWSALLPVDLVSPQSTPYAADFPTATRCWREGAEYEGHQGFLYRYERIASGGYYILGVAVQADTFEYIVDYVAEALNAPLPLSYPASWTTVGRWEMEHFPGYVFVYTDSSIRTVDAWGTLETEFGTKAVLRIFCHDYSISDPPVGPTITTQGAVYVWVDLRGVTVCEYSSVDQTGDPDFTTADVTLTGWDFLSAEPARGPVARLWTASQNYPNPFNAETVLPLELARSARLTVDIYDATGRLVSSERRDLPPGHSDLHVDGSRWATGTYFARLSSADATHTVRMQLLK